jgi:hypothetical protein
MRIKQIAIALAILVSAVTTLPAKNLRYLGKAGDDGTRGRVHHEGKSYTVREGDEIAGWGKVKSVTDEYLVIERTLTADEKRDREAKGLAAPDVQDVHVPNAMRTLVCSRDCAQPEQ